MLGALSLILWTITLMVTIKYILIILHADNDGEGGTFSTYSLLSKYVSLLCYEGNEVDDMTRSAHGV